MSSNKYRGNRRNFEDRDIMSSLPDYGAEDPLNNVEQPEPEIEDVVVQPEPRIDTFVPQDFVPSKKHIVSGCRRLNIRKEPSTSSDIIGTFLNSDVVDVVSVINEDWIEVKTRYGVGFIMSKFVEEVE